MSWRSLIQNLKGNYKSFGALLSTVTVFFNPPLENPVIEPSKAPLPSDDGGRAGGAELGAGGGGAPAGGGGGGAGPAPIAGGGGGAPVGAGGAEIIKKMETNLNKIYND